MTVETDRVARPQLLRDAWYMIGWAREMDKSALMPVKILGEPLVIYRSKDKWTALEDVCCHRLVPLSLGRIEDGCVRCMYHGLKFAADGKCVEIPGQRNISSAIRVRAYPVAHRNGAIWVWLGAAERADERLIPYIASLDDERFNFACGSVTVASEASLIWDNLLDLTHIPFAHEQTFGGGDPVAVSKMIEAETENLMLETIERGVHTARWHLAKPNYAFLGGGGTVTDEYVVADFIAPGALIIQTEVYPEGTGAHRAKPPAGAVPSGMRVACQVVVPVSDKEARIFYHTGIERDSGRSVEDMARLLEAVLQEDKLFIESQFAKMRELPNRRPMNLAMDQAAVKFKAVMRRLLVEAVADRPVQAEATAETA